MRVPMVYLRKSPLYSDVKLIGYFILQMDQVRSTRYDGAAPQVNLRWRLVLWITFKRESDNHGES